MNEIKAQRKSKLALASLLLGVVGLLTAVFCIGGFISFLAVIVGYIARNQIKKSADIVTGRGRATWGLRLGYIGVALCVLMEIKNELIWVRMLQVRYNGHQIYYATLPRLIETTNTDSRPWDLSTNLDAFSGQSGRSVTSILDNDMVWPSSAKYSTSTAYFSGLAATGASPSSIREMRTFSIFAAPGITAYSGSNSAFFKSENNAWCVVADLNDASPDKMPFLITRNVRANMLADLHGRVADTCDTGAPFGRKLAVVVLKRGEVFIMGDEMDWSAILGTNVFTNRILRP